MHCGDKIHPSECIIPFGISYLFCDYLHKDLSRESDQEEDALPVSSSCAQGKDSV